jgi:hypothetical protein
VFRFLSNPLKGVNHEQTTQCIPQTPIAHEPGETPAIPEQAHDGRVPCITRRPSVSQSPLIHLTHERNHTMNRKIHISTAFFLTITVMAVVLSLFY